VGCAIWLHGPRKHADSGHLYHLEVGFEGFSQFVSTFFYLIDSGTLNNFFNLSFILEELVIGVSRVHVCRLLQVDAGGDLVGIVEDAARCLDSERVAVVVDVLLLHGRAN